MRKGPLHSAPDYTVACLWMGFINLLMVFITLWAIWGLIAVGALAYVINLAIKRLEARRTKQQF